MPSHTISALSGHTGFAGAPQERGEQSASPATLLLALGIVYGDLGTTPLYTMQTIVHLLGSDFSADAALGTLSLIVWALIITISIKYSVFVMRPTIMAKAAFSR
nr:KUP/HAK/KT family potassium transporter [Bradyrhizobium rifense]